jgi:hypothetical protein
MNTPTDKLGNHPTLYIDEELSAQIDALAAERGITRKEMLDTLIRRGLEVETDKLKRLSGGDQ